MDLEPIGKIDRSQQIVSYDLSDKLTVAKSCGKKLLK